MNPYSPARHPGGQRAQVVPRTVRVDVRDFGASSTSADTSAQIQAALNSGASEVTLGPTGSYRAAVTIPAGVTLLSEGASLRPVAPATAGYVVQTGGINASILNVTFNAVNDPGLIGNERIVNIKHAGARMSGCTLTGNGFRHGVIVEAPSGGACDDGEISNCTFNTLSFGILKIGTAGSAHRFKYLYNRIKNIMRGDGIELNVGADIGFVVEGNIIENVRASTLPNTGIGIGIAGGSYGGDELAQMRYWRIVGNYVRDAEVVGIHVEACARGRILDNTVLQELAPSTAIGVEVYGCTRVRVEGNHVAGWTIGVKDDPGVISGAYVISTDKTTIVGNDIEDCTTGIVEGVAGARKTAKIASNRLTSCATGIRLQGGATVTVQSNIFTDCAVPVGGDLAPLVKSAINAPARLGLAANMATLNGQPQALGSALTNTSLAVISERGNSFHLGTTSTKWDYHQPGDVVADGFDQIVCTSPGWLKLDALNYRATAVAGTQYLTVTSPGGDPSVGWRIGQAISLPGAGASGAALVAIIEDIRPLSGEWRLWITATVATTVTTPAIISIAQTATYALISYRPGADQWLREAAASFAFALISPTAWANGGSGKVTASGVRWTDGTTGTFAGTVDPGGDYTGWMVTWAGTSTRTVTVAGISKDANGNRVGPTSITVS